MNESLFSSPSTDLQRAGDRRARLRGSQTPPISQAPTAAGTLAHAAQGAHSTHDRGVERAAPATRQLGEAASLAEHALHEKTDQIREARDEWMGGLRSAVQKRPLSCMAAAFAFGVVVARLTR